MARRTITITHRTGADGDLKLDDIIAVGFDDAPVALEPATAKLLAARRAATEAAIDGSAPVYGFNRGFGSNVRDAVDPASARALQANLIRSHCVGMGEPAPREIVRATMLLRARSLARGYSAIRPALVELLIGCLNAGITPVIPRHGSVSASGDLAPLSHVALALIGEGEVFVGGAGEAPRRMAAAKALKAAGLETLTLEMKEGLALNNGCQYSAAWMALAAFRMRALTREAALATALAAQVMFGSDAPFSAALHALRPHPGSRAAARWIHDLMAQSGIREFHRDFDVDGEVQDPYNLRCAAQILGPCIDLVGRAVATLETEANSVTDNPIDLNWDEDCGAEPLGGAYDVGRLTSGGHFHGMALAVDAYGLLQAAGIMARLSNMRCARYVDAARNKGLGPQLRWPGEDPHPAEAAETAKRSTESGMMLVEYAAAGLTNWIWGLSTPSHLFSISTDCGQEDHVSMAANVAQRAVEAADRLAEAVAAELAFAAQAAALRQKAKLLKTRALAAPAEPSRADHEEARDAKGRDFLRTYQEHWWRPMTDQETALSAPCERALAAIRDAFPTVTQDRALADDLARLAALVRQGDVARASGYDFALAPHGGDA